MAKAKLKTKRSAAKRIRVNKKGKVKRAKAYKGHLLGHKKRKRKRRLKKGALVSAQDSKRMRRLLPYG